MKILIAEDNPMWATLLSRNAESWSFEPIVATDGQQAVEILEREDSICIAILDWQMPQMTGLEVCRQIKADSTRPFTYVVMLTNRDSKDDIVEGLDAGADDYLTKPVEMVVLRSRLNAARRIVEAIPPKDWARPSVEGYDVKRVLGKGAFATVWEAERRSDQMPVAIKVLRVDLASDKVFERFAREVKILETLDHQYITKIHESRVDRKAGYYVMDLVRGGTLHDHQKHESLSGSQRIRMIQRVCEGLDHAHQMGVVHRDLKFTNVMITEEGLPKIVDFGMSKSLFKPETDDVNLTIEGSVLGTPLFMSPEQARGEVAKIDGRSDLYSAATMLYILLLKHHPHPIVNNDNRTIIDAISHAKVRPPSFFKNDFNVDLGDIITKALAAEPEDRYQTAGEFADALRLFLENRGK